MDEEIRSLKSRMGSLKSSIDGWEVLKKRDAHWPEAYNQAVNAQTREIAEYAVMESKLVRLQAERKSLGTPE